LHLSRIFIFKLSANFRHRLICRIELEDHVRREQAIGASRKAVSPICFVTISELKPDAAIANDSAPLICNGLSAIAAVLSSKISTRLPELLRAMINEW
jgi:hypothetical protein